jgi:chromosomal replication initiation ATPase DnaA
MPIIEERVGKVFDQTEHTTVVAAVNNELRDDREWTSDHYSVMAPLLR